MRGPFKLWMIFCLVAMVGCQAFGDSQTSDPQSVKLLDQLALKHGQAVVDYAYYLEAVSGLKRVVTYQGGAVSSKMKAIDDKESKRASDAKQIDDLHNLYNTLAVGVRGLPRNGPRREMTDDELRLRSDPALLNQRLQQALTVADNVVVHIQTLRRNAELQLSRLTENGKKEPSPAVWQPSTVGLIDGSGKTDRLLFGISAFGDYNNYYWVRPLLDLFEYDFGGWQPGGQTEPWGWQSPERFNFAAFPEEIHQPTLISLRYATGSWMYVPAWFLPKYRDEPGIWLDPSPEAKTRPRIGSQEVSLDPRHPLVRTTILDQVGRVAEHYRDEKKVFAYMGPWEFSPVISWDPVKISGYSLSARRAFHEYLGQKYRTIAELNSAWRSKYESFEQIEPPTNVYETPRLETTPLTYEFEKFRKDSIADWMQACYDKVKAADPNHPVIVDLSTPPFNGGLYDSVDLFQIYSKACDIVSHHPSTRPFDLNYIWSLNRYIGKTIGSVEYIWNFPEGFSGPSEAVSTAAGLRNLWRHLAYDFRVFYHYAPNDSYSAFGEKPSAYNNMLDFNNDYHTVSDPAAILAVMHRKTRASNQIWMTSKIITPQIAVLQPSTSIMDAYPTDGVHSVAYMLDELLYREQYNYAVVPEETILDGRENLRAFRVLILPYATHFPPGLSDKILKWVRGGGSLIAAGPFGVYDAWGFPDSKAMSKVFGRLDCKYSGTRLDWRVSPIQRSGNSSREIATGIWSARYGNGKVLMSLSGDRYLRISPKLAGLALNPKTITQGVGCSDIENAWRELPGESPFLVTDDGSRAFYAALDASVDRFARSENGFVELIPRKDKQGRTFLVAINPDCDRVVNARICLNNQYQAAIDHSIDGGADIPLAQTKRGSDFSIRLAPGEGALIQLIP